MAEREDIVVTWPLSPRIITVQAPSTEITQQDLLDTLRKLECQFTALDDDSLIDATGKENLGGGVLVGITNTLQNAQLAFEARTMPTETGTATEVGTTTLTDVAAQFQTAGVQRGALVINFSDYSVAEVLIVDSQTQLTHRPLTGGAGNDWSIGDVYKIFNIVQCDVTGGNIVSVDGAGNRISPVFPTAFTQIVKTASSSATLQEMAEETITKAVWDANRHDHSEVGTMGEAIYQAAIQVLATATVAAGSTNKVIKTTLTQENTIFDGAILQVVSRSRITSRKINTYVQSEGTCVLGVKLPFVPIAGDQVFILSSPIDVVGIGY